MNKRLNNVSLLRFLSFICIVVFHCLMVLSSGEGKQIFPTYFAVQIFVFLTGFLYSKKKIENVKEFYIKNAVKLILPMVVFMLVEWLLCLIVNPSIANPANWGKHMESGLFALGHLWFMWFILIAYALIPFLQIAFDKNHRFCKLAKSLIIIVFILELCYFGIFNTQVNIMPLFAGYIFGKQEDKIVRRGGAALIASLMFVLFEGIYIILRNCIKSDISIISNFINGGQYYLAVLLAVCFSIAFLIWFEFLNKYDSFKFLKFTDKYAFQIYFYHHIFIVGTLSMLSLTPYVSVNIILMLLATLVCAVVMEFVSGKLIKFINKLIFKKKKQIS